jgi:hypothetical protein
VAVTRQLIKFYLLRSPISCKQAVPIPHNQNWLSTFKGRAQLEVRTRGRRWLATGNFEMELSVQNNLCLVAAAALIPKDTCLQHQEVFTERKRNT